jgi:lactate permease
MALTLWLMATHGYYSISSFTAGLVGIAVTIALTRLPAYRRATEAERGPRPVMGGEEEATVAWGRVLVALSAYLVLIVRVLSASLLTPVGTVLEWGTLNLAFPATHTAYGWTNAATPSYRSIAPFGHAGALLLYAAVLGYLIYRKAGLYQPGALGRIARKTVAGAVPSSLGIITLVGMALLMMESGMTFLLARGIATVAGAAFPFLAPFIGVLGCFMTGSNTNSNILFGALQRDTARLVGLPVATILAAQTVGGALGGVLAPAKLIVGCSTVGLSGQEGPVIRASVKYGVAMTIIVGIAALVAVAVVG